MECPSRTMRVGCVVSLMPSTLEDTTDSIKGSAWHTVACFTCELFHP